MRLAGHDGQQKVNLSTMPPEERCKHVKVATLTRMVDVYVSAVPVDDAMTCDKGIKWKSLRVRADVTMGMGIGGTQVPIAFPLQKPVLLAGFAAKDLSDAHIGALKAIPLLRNVHTGTMAVARKKVAMAVDEDPEAWSRVKAQLMKWAPLDIGGALRKKIQVSSWADTREVVLGLNVFAPGKDMSRDFQRAAMAAMAYCTAARLVHEDKISLFDSDLQWPRSSLVDHEPIEDQVEEDVDLEQLFAAYTPALNAEVPPKPRAAEAPGGRQERSAGAGDGNGKQNKSAGTKLKLAQRVLEQCLEAAQA